MAWEFACPACRSALVSIEGAAQRCPICAVVYGRHGGIWRFLAADRQEAFGDFVRQYERVRAAEGRGTHDPARLRALPFHAPSRALSREWRVRSRSYRAVLQHVVQPIERRCAGPLRFLDLGSGLGWLAYRLALRGHQVAGVDLLTNDFDGLGTHRHYDCVFDSVQAEFDRLPFTDRTVDVVIYNAAFHYSGDYVATLAEALRVLVPGGCVVIMDSPLYRDRTSGAAMVREREDAFRGQYGFARSGIETEGFLTYARLEALESACSLRWKMFEPWYGVGWWARPILARFRGAREPARFKLIIGRAR